MTFSYGESYGFDSGASCSEKTARRGRLLLLKSIPCDLKTQAYCDLPGTMYPWNAVRRFVNENQGMMKRMYGDVRHISVLRNEINNNDITLEDVQETAIRYSRAGWKRNKYLYQESGKSKSNDLLADAHYRRGSYSNRANTRATTTTRTTSSTVDETVPSSTTTILASTSRDTMKSKHAEKREKMTTITAEKSNAPLGMEHENYSNYDEAIEAAIEEIFIDFDGNNTNNQISSNETYSQNVFSQTTTESNLNSNIHIVGAPDLTVLMNKSEPVATISTTLRVHGFSKEEKSTTSTPFNTTIENSTLSSRIDNYDVNENNINSTKSQDNVNIIPTEIDDHFDETSTNTAIAEPIQTESNFGINEKKTEKITAKPIEENSIGQLYQDVAEKEDPIFSNSRGV